MVYQYRYKDTNEQLKRSVWEKGREITQNGQRFDPAIWRHDICGKVMKYSEHGNTDSEYGWEIDHIFPSSKGGSDKLDNLQPLQWENNREKSDQYPWP